MSQLCLIFELLSSHAANAIARNRRNSFSDVHSSIPRSPTSINFPQEFLSLSLTLTFSYIIFKGYAALVRDAWFTRVYSIGGHSYAKIRPWNRLGRTRKRIPSPSLPPSTRRCALYSRCRIGGASVLHVQRNLARCVKYTVAPLSPCIWIFQQDLSLSLATLSPG